MCVHFQEEKGEINIIREKLLRGKGMDGLLYCVCVLAVYVSIQTVCITNVITQVEMEKKAGWRNHGGMMA